MSKLKKLLKGSKFSKMDLVQKLAEDAQANDTSVRRKKEVLDSESLAKAREELRKEKKAKRQMKRSARWKNIELEKAKGPRAKRKFMYKPGDLVTIKRDLPWHNVKKGDMGIVCDQDDTGQDYLLRYEEQRFLWVMGPRDLERWDASWVEWAEDEEDDIETIEHDVSDVEVPDTENFEILEDKTDVHPTEENPVEVESQWPSQGDMIMITEPPRGLYKDPHCLELLRVAEPSDIFVVMGTSLFENSASAILEVLVGDELVYIALDSVNQVELLS